MICGIILGFIVRSLYHKVVDVTYFGFNGVIKEIFTIFGISILICRYIGLP